jgi:hypothetical protein
MRGLVFAMENDEVSLSDDTGVDASMNEMEIGAAEVATEAQEIVQTVSDVESATADAQTLEKVQDVVGQTVQSGQGMDETTAQVAQVVVESICVRLGIPNSRRVIPSIESFGSSNSRLAATRVAMENGFTDMIKRIWEAIKKVWNSIKDFFARFFANADKVKKAAEIMRDSIQTKLAGKTPKDKKFTTGSVWSNFNEKNASSKAIVTKTMENHKKLTSGVMAFTTDSFKIGTTIEKTADEMVKIGVSKKGYDKYAEVKGSTTVTLGHEDSLKSMASAIAMIDQAVGTLLGHVSSVKAERDSKASNDKNNVEVKSYGPFIGGNNISLVKTTPKEQKLDDKIFFISVEYANRPSDADKNKEVEVLSATEMIAYCDTVIELMDLTNDLGKKKNDIVKVGEALVKVTEGMLALGTNSASGGGAENTTARTEINNMKILFTNFNSMVTRVFTQTPAWNVRAGKAALNYCHECVKQYKA